MAWHTGDLKFVPNKILRFEDKNSTAVVLGAMYVFGVTMTYIQTYHYKYPYKKN
jgi:hypothetical protein